MEHLIEFSRSDAAKKIATKAEKKEFKETKERERERGLCMKSD